MLLGRVLLPEHKNNISKSMKKRQCIINGVTYESTEYAAKCLNIPSGTLWNKCKNLNNTNYYFL